MTTKILIIGGTGNIGTPLVDLIAQSDADYRVLARSDASLAALHARNIPTVKGAMGDWPSIDLALQGIDTVFLLSSPTPEMRDLHLGLIDRAKLAGVRKVVRLSAEPARIPEGMPLYEDHAAADAHLMASGLDYAILRPHYFMQNIPQMHASFIKQQQMFAQYLGEARIPMVDARDIAQAAFALLTEELGINQIHYITGPRAISYTDVAKAYSAALDAPITYVSLSYEDQKAGLTAAGLPEWTVETVMTVFKQWVDAGEIAPTGDYEQLTRRQPTSLETFVADTAATL